MPLSFAPGEAYQFDWSTFRLVEFLAPLDVEKLSLSDRNLLVGRAEREVEDLPADYGLERVRYPSVVVPNATAFFEQEISLAVLPNTQSELPFGQASPTVAIASLI